MKSFLSNRKEKSSPSFAAARDNHTYTTERAILKRKDSFTIHTSNMVEKAEELKRNEFSPDLLSDDASDNNSTRVEEDDDVSVPSVMVSFDEAARIQIVEEAPPISDVEKEWMTVMGRVEVLMLEDQDEDGRLINKRIQIICLPEDSFQVSSFLRDRYYQQQEEAEGQEVPISILEQFTNTFMESCAMQCDREPTVAPKSAMRKDGDDRSVRLSRSVTFDKIDIHEFNMTLGDHPSAVSGPPMMLDWNAKTSSCMSLDDYERRRGVRRHRRQLKMSMKTRCGILQTEGNFSAAAITQAWEQAMVVRRQRRETLKGGVFQMVYEDFWESANRKWRRVTDSVSGMIF
mmetsp:Transcript_39258/g.81472  ORF Transcript_39258/g.81472 Transcript_39258/m.81472 type:complete len:345 (-) Transcript_39258:250-1284(-)